MYLGNFLSWIKLNSKQALREILIDELHSHLYLKSVFTSSRWVAYTPSQQTRECSPRCIS